MCQNIKNASDLLWLVRNQDRHTAINAARDATRADGRNSVDSEDKGFVAKYDRIKRAALEANAAE